MSDQDIIDNDINDLYSRLNREAGTAGYNLNPDADFTRGLIKSLIINEERYGYMACPCRLASGNREEDLDIICPCDYRDPDLSDYDACYCALYVSEAVLKGVKQVSSIPERRLPPENRTKEVSAGGSGSIEIPMPVWRCKVCGYLCAREEPPEVCPICKANRDRFEVFLKPAT